jgi:hypothetical protein
VHDSHEHAEDELAAMGLYPLSGGRVLRHGDELLKRPMRILVTTNNPERPFSKPVVDHRLDVPQPDLAERRFGSHSPPHRPGRFHFIAVKLLECAPDCGE